MACLSPWCQDIYIHDPKVRRILERLLENDTPEFVHRASPPETLTRYVILFGNRLIDLDHVTELGVWYRLSFEGRALVDPDIQINAELTRYYHTISREM
jgi:hypothetical protein